MTASPSMPDPDAVPGPDAVRIGTMEREQAVEALGTHFSEGRLETHEYEERVTTALAAQTRADLAPIFADLPNPHPACLRPPPPAYPMSPFPPTPYAAAPLPAYPRYPAYRSDKSRVVTGLLQILLPFGVGRLYAGHIGLGITQLMVTLFTFGIGAIWPLIDGIIILANGGTDGYGRRLLE